MTYLKLLKAHRKTNNQPTISVVQFTMQQKRWVEQGLCVLCGIRDSIRTSYLCKYCMSKDTFEDISSAIDALKRKMLDRSRG